MNTSNPESDRHSGISKATIFAGILVVVGALLAVTVDMLFLLVFAAGVFGPGALRELGVLNDQDEFQREASRAAGYRAYLAAGLFVSAWLAVGQRGMANLDSELAMTVSMVLILLIVVWLLSALFGYWDARRATFRILLAFGSFWLAFVVLSHLTEPAMLLWEALVAAPFFVLAWTAQRWPRSTGIALVSVSVFAFFAFDMYEAFSSRLNAWPVILTMFLPLTACGLALLRVGSDGTGEETEDQ